MKVTDYIVNELAKLGVRHVFGYQGGNISHMIDSLGNSKEIQFVQTYNEQGAAFAACGYALSTNGIGVALASSGPGAINLVSGIANAYYDSIPCIFITGTVSRHTMKKDNEDIRQNAFQEHDIVSMVSGVTKYAKTIMDALHIEEQLHIAINAMMAGRKGPVLFDLPHDIQRAEINVSESDYGITQNKEIDEDKFQQVLQLLHDAKRPVILIGGGATSAISRSRLNELLDKIEIPVVSSLRAIDVINHEKKCYCGFIGTYGNRYANLAIEHSDLIIVFGSRIDERQISPSLREEISNKKIIQVDIDVNEIGRNIKTDVSIDGCVEDFLKCILSCNLNLKFTNWLTLIKKWENEYPSSGKKNEFTANMVIHKITFSAQPGTVFCADVGNNQMCTAQAAFIHEGSRLLNSAGLGAMGFSLPAAIGASYTAPHVVCFSGDGGIQMNLQELQTIARDKLNIKIVIFNNGCLGMIKEVQTILFNSRFYGTVDGFSSPDFQKIAFAYDLGYRRIENIQDLNDVACMINVEGASIFEVVLQNEMNTIPKVGVDIFTQNPQLSDDEYACIKKEVAKCENTMC